jgi:hypothetical protein
MGTCAKTARKVPADCLGKCAITGTRVLRHFLVESAVSKRLALAEHAFLIREGVRRRLRVERVIAVFMSNSPQVVTRAVNQPSQKPVASHSVSGEPVSAV